MRPKYLGLALLSAAALAFEITLTRLFSVTQWYHFAFLAVSVALLGYGASGTALSLVPRWTGPPTGRRPAILSVLFAASVIGSYLVLNHLPFDSYRIAWERVQILYLVLYYLALTVPFFCAGLVTGLLLAVYPGLASRVYGANLLGSALGGLLPVLILPLVGEGAVLIIAAVGLLAALTFQSPSALKALVATASAIHERRKSLLPTRAARSSNIAPRRHQALVVTASAALILCSALLVIVAWNPPAIWNLRLSPYKGLSQVQRFPDAKTVSRDWNAFSRVDRVSSSAIRSAPGLSLSYSGRLPEQDGLFVDGDDLSPRLNAGASDDLTAHLPVALPYQLRPKCRALVLEPRGGLDVVVALEQGADSVVAVEANPLLIKAAGMLYDDSRVRIILNDGRSYAHRSAETFDVVHLSLGDSFRPVTSGAYSLGERYDLTVEAFEEYLILLRPGGLLVIQRWLQVPPSELLRAGAAAVEALQRSGVKEPGASLAVLRSWQVGLILVKNGAFDANELTAIREFAQAQEMDLVALPGMAATEANQLNVLEAPVYFQAFGQLLSDAQQLYAGHSADVRPATDDRPFFFHFFRWGQTTDLLARLGRTWQPWGGSGYFVLIALLVVAAAASAVLILLPMVVVRDAPTATATGRTKLRVLLYFGLLGMGFLFVEIPLMQRFILFLGQPIYAFTAVLVAVLFFSGLGSLAAARLSIRWTLPALVVAILLLPLILPIIFQALLGAPLARRLLVTGLVLAVPSFLMGTAFPGGLIWLRLRVPGLIPWAWAINGCASVLASVLAAMIAISAGFSWVLVLGAMAYAAAWLTLR